MNSLERKLAITIIVFPVAVILSRAARTDPALEWVALLPVLPALALGVLGFEIMRRKDEMHRRMLLEAAAFAVAVTFAVSLTWLLLQGYLVLPAPTALGMLCLLVASWFAGLGLAWRRYCAG